MSVNLERLLAGHRTVATGLGEWCCGCDPAKWRPTAHRESHLADVIRSEWLPGALAEEGVVEAGAFSQWSAAIRASGCPATDAEIGQGWQLSPPSVRAEWKSRAATALTAAAEAIREGK